jgi:hypothetical protein
VGNIVSLLAATVAGVLFLLFGSSAAGKTCALGLLRDRVEALATHDFDELGVPPGADSAWRRGANERWLRRALQYQTHGTDLLLAGQTPFGELLAAPSAPHVEAISACLIDCDDGTRVGRLQARGADWLARSGSEIEDYLSWAAWMRGHAANPTWRAEVIRQDDDLHWDRWIDWRAGDPRWNVRVLDTSQLRVEQVTDELAAWIGEERARFRNGTHPLSNWTDTPDAYCGT